MGINSEYVFVIALVYLISGHYSVVGKHEQPGNIFTNLHFLSSY